MGICHQQSNTRVCLKMGDTHKMAVYMCIYIKRKMMISVDHGILGSLIFIEPPICNLYMYIYNILHNIYVYNIIYI